MRKENKNKNNKIISLPLVLFVMIVLTSLLVALTYFEMDRYEDGILDVCATQQDSYVQLVIDQINIKENRTDQEIIEQILSTLDSSNNRYWTFSKESTMLYVKDALETNRYQSLTAKSYYTSDSAKEFFDSLYVNKVQHKRIILDNKEYIASGALFRYQGEDYTICLLTNTTVLLDNNKFLGSKMELIIIFVVVYSLIFILPLVMVIINNSVQKQIMETTDELTQVNRNVEKLNEELTTSEIYDNRLNLFSLPVVQMFIDEYRERRKAFPISFIAFRYGEKETVSNFFGKNSVYFGKRDIKFYDGRLHLALLLCVRCSQSQAKELAASVYGECELLGIATAISSTSLDKRFEQILKNMGNPQIVETKVGKVMRPDSRTESRYRVKDTGGKETK